MRADRLVAALLFLQARGRVTAAELAAELEVSERTARRDLEALTASGVPVYAQRGRGGGWRLVGGARTDLTGLTSPEVRALFLAAGSSGASPELRAALRKLLRAVPEPLRPDAEAASRARIVDELDWSGTAVTAADPHLTELERAVRFLATEEKLVVEAGGAAGVAALLAGKVDTGGLTPVAVLSGGNILPSKLASILAAAQ